jgi:hypothetical protein
MPIEDLYGVIWAPCLRYGSGLGYGLVITSARVVGTRKTPWLSGFFGYLGPGSHISPGDRAKGTKIATELIAEKEFEIPKGSVSKIMFKDPGAFSNDHAIFKTNQPDIQIDLLNPPGDMTIVRVTPKLKGSLVEFTPDRTYNEATGALFRDEYFKRVAEKQQELAEKQQKVAEKQAKKALKQHWW